MNKPFEDALKGILLLSKKEKTEERDLMIYVISLNLVSAMKASINIISTIGSVEIKEIIKVLEKIIYNYESSHIIR